MRKAELAAFKCEAVAADDCWSRLPERIVFEMGLKKDQREAFCTKLRNAKVGLDQLWALGHKRESGFQNFLFSVCRSASKECPARHERSEKGNSFLFWGEILFLCIEYRSMSFLFH